VDISLGGERACNGLKLGGRRGKFGVSYGRTAITFTEQEHISAVPILLLSLAIGMPLLYSIVFYSANKAPCHFSLCSFVPPVSVL
jgi:hypothetical protein